MAEQNVITAAEVETARANRVSLVEKMADKYSIDRRNMMRTLKATAFRGDVSDEQMAALLIVADQHNLNPWLKEIYAFPSRQGIVPIVGVDGWARIINEHPQFDGMDFEQDDEKCTCRMYRKDRAHPISVTEYLAECNRRTDPWVSHPKRMLRHKAMIQCARLAFSFAGIYDPDEGERVLAAENAIDITPRGEDEVQETDLGPAKIGPVKMRKIVDGLNEAVGKQDTVAVQKIRSELNNAEWLLVWKQLRSWERTAINKALEASKALPQGDDLDAWALEAIRTAKDSEALKASYRLIEDAYAEADLQVPDKVATACDARRAEIG